jgi:hypothetical protein
VSEGDGPLLHELTHALMACDLPDAPPWFEEGLAALHETSRLEAGPHGPRLKGLTNWRLDVLRREVDRERLRSLDWLRSVRRLAGPDEAVCYAYARYVCRTKAFWASTTSACVSIVEKTNAASRPGTRSFPRRTAATWRPGSAVGSCLFPGRTPRVHWEAEGLDPRERRRGTPGRRTAEKMTSAFALSAPHPNSPRSTGARELCFGRAL